MDIYKSYGSVEGCIDAIHLQRIPMFFILDPLGKMTLCHFDKALLGQVQAALGKRVSVTGLIHSNESGNVLRMDVESIDVFPAEEDLPTLEDVIGILG